jgi:hypothetical protein
VITTSPASLSTGGLFRLQLSTVNDGAQLRLIGTWRNAPRRAEGLPETALSPSVLLDHLGAVRFAYFGRAEPGDPEDWHDRWQAPLALPKLIRLRVVFADGWQSPDLIVAPRLAAEPQVNG